MGSRTSFLLGTLALIVLALGSGCNSRGKGLPALSADLSHTSVSGLSAGGYMAGQFHLAHSSTVTGAAILAAGPFGCAASPGAEAFPYFPAAVASNLAQALNGCIAGASGAGVLDSHKLVRSAAVLAAAGKIDPLSNLQQSKVYLWKPCHPQSYARNPGTEPWIDTLGVYVGGVMAACDAGTIGSPPCRQPALGALTKDIPPTWRPARSRGSALSMN